MFDKKKFYIAGVQFRSARDKEALVDYQEGDKLYLEAEPENKYDPNAIKIVDEGNSFHFGYVPKKFSAEVSSALELGLNLECTIVTHNPTKKPWEMCEVEIAEVESQQEYDYETNEKLYEIFEEEK